MSPRAAWRLVRLGFDAVHDYAPGKVDWMVAGLPTVRADTVERRAIDGADRSPTTCGPDATRSQVDDLIGSSGSVLVVADGIVFGRVRPRQLETVAAGARAEEFMELGPTTVRAHEPLEPLLERMAARQTAEVIVTTPEGRLLGTVHRPRTR